MLALAYGNDTLDIYDGAVCYMFYRLFEKGIGMIWVRIFLPDDFDLDRLCALFKALKVDGLWSFTNLSAAEIARYFHLINTDLSYWCNKFARERLAPRYQMRGSLVPVIVYDGPLLFRRSDDPVLSRFHRKWLLAYTFASALRGMLT